MPRQYFGDSPGGVNFCMEAAYKDYVVVGQPPPPTRSHAMHTCTHARLVGKLLVAVWRAGGLCGHADTSLVQPR